MELRAKILPVEGGLLVEWIDAERKVHFTEQIKIPNPEYAAVSQLVFDKPVRTEEGFFVDPGGLRHFYIHAEPLRLRLTAANMN
jgi:hypothetical protein